MSIESIYKRTGIKPEQVWNLLALTHGLPYCCLAQASPAEVATLLTKMQLASTLTDKGDLAVEIPPTRPGKAGSSTNASVARAKAMPAL